jgi:hypothetical protein
MAKVYRVENREGIGPYADDNYGSTVVRMRADHNDGRPIHVKVHPSPFVSLSVLMGTEPTTAKCAFDSMQALFRWFGGWLPGLLKEGYRIAAFDSDVKYGPDDVGQVIFYDQRKIRRR